MRYSTPLRAELPAPPVDALLRRGFPPFGQDEPDIPQAQAEHMGQPDRAADHLGREAVLVVPSALLNFRPGSTRH